MNAPSADNTRLTKSLVARMKRVILNNKARLLQEIRETTELYELLVKWSAGVALTDDEKAAVKAQLFDICRTIPALAVFMAPFGSVILILLIRYLPFDIRPSAFRETKE